MLQVLEDVRGIIAEQLGTDLDKVEPNSKFVDLGADSLDTVEIMMALEEKFDLQLDEEGAEKISTVQVCMLPVSGSENSSEQSLQCGACYYLTASCTNIGLDL